MEAVLGLAVLLSVGTQNNAHASQQRRHILFWYLHECSIGEVKIMEEEAAKSFRDGFKVEIGEYILEEVVLDDWYNMLDDVVRIHVTEPYFGVSTKPVKPFLKVVEFPDSPLNEGVPIQT